MSQQAVPFSYDETPYASWPFAQSHPNRLAAIGKLFGLSPAPIESCRILELGSAAGGNLIPIAEAYPQARLVGVDLSKTEIEDGQACVSALGLQNLTLRHANILDVAASDAEYDYVIVHGVYSWVPPEVQEHILRVIRGVLAPQGIGYVSYNTHPGWRMRGMIRDMLLFHTSETDEAKQKTRQARELLEFLTRNTSVDTAYGKYLSQELELFNGMDDSFLLHDQLEAYNEPLYFHEFMQRAQATGLAYLGEAELHSMVTSNYSSEVEQTLRSFSRDTIEIEQYMDFLRNRTFRQTLLVREDCPVDHSLQRARLDELYFASKLEPEVRLPADSDLTVGFTAGQSRVEVHDRITRHALQSLLEVYPRWLGFRELLEIALERSQWPGTPEQAGANLAESLIRCSAGNVIELHGFAAPFVSQVSEHPQVAAFCRWQAQRGNMVSSRRHELIKIDSFGREILPLLDGSRDQAELLEEAIKKVERGELKMTRDEKPLEDVDEQRKVLNVAIENALDQFRSAALLMG